MTAFVLTLVTFLLPLAYNTGPGNLVFVVLGARFGFLSRLPYGCYDLISGAMPAALKLLRPDDCEDYRDIRTATGVFSMNARVTPPNNHSRSRWWV